MDETLCAGFLLSASNTHVIVMTFWYVFGMDFNFSNFLNFIFTWD